MISDERLEIIFYIMNKKNISIELIKSLFEVDNLKEISKGQAVALEKLLVILWEIIIPENIKDHLVKMQLFHLKIEMI